MWKIGIRVGLLLAIVFLLLPAAGYCQSGTAQDIRGLQKVLDTLYDEILPLCSGLIGIGQAIAGFAATFYIGSRVWKSIANAEPIDFYPLFRPFVLGFCIMNFSLCIGVLNGILKPTITGTSALLDNTNQTVEKLIAQRQQEMEKSPAYMMYAANDGEGNKDLWMQYTQTANQDDGDFLGIGSSIRFTLAKTYYNMKNWFKEFLSTVLEIFYEAAALCINTIRTFNLLIMAMLGPIVFGLAVFDGFQHTLQVYLARYINFYLWLPIANILGALLGKIQEGMIKLDIQQIGQTGDSFFSTNDIGYLIFMIIGIVAYFTIPNLSNIVVNTGSGSALTSKISMLSSSTTRTAAALAGGIATGGAGMAADAFGNAKLLMTKGSTGYGTASDYFNDKLKG
jgi:conjugative transposon TraJ protein